LTIDTHPKEEETSFGFFFGGECWGHEILHGLAEERLWVIYSIELSISLGSHQSIVKKTNQKKHFLCTSNVKMHHSYYSMGRFQWHIATPLFTLPKRKKNFI
jgi:hypothetical protein